jgi:hypothetical protein
MNEESRPARRLPNDQPVLSVPDQADEQGEQLSLDEEAESWDEWIQSLPVDATSIERRRAA